LGLQLYLKSKYFNYFIVNMGGTNAYTPR